MSKESIHFDGITIESELPGSHLGNQLGPCMQQDFITSRVSDFTRRVNVLCATFSHVTSDVKYNLFKSYCMSLYGCPLWDLDSKDIGLFYVAWRKCIRRIFRLHPMTHSKLLHLICQNEPIHDQLCNRFRNFYTSCVKSDNAIIRYCIKLAETGSRSAVCNNINVCRMGFKPVLCNDEYDQSTAGTIRDFISLRDYGYDRNNVQQILDYLCTM